MPFRDGQERKRYRREYYRVWRKKNPSKTSEYNRTYRLKNPEKVKGQTKQRHEKRKRYERQWRLTNPEKQREYGRKYYRLHRAKMIAKRKRQRHEHPETQRAYETKNRLKAAATARRHLAKKNGWIECTDYPSPPSDSKCAICHRESKPLCLDHDHETGKFRGYLCRDCNMALGKLGDTTEAIRRVLGYLEH